MVNDRLDGLFGALASPVRRDLVARLSRGPATVGELAEPLTISLPALSKHLTVLEEAGLLTRTKQGRTVHCALVPGALGDAEQWLARHRDHWTAALDRLTDHLDHHIDPLEDE